MLRAGWDPAEWAAVITAAEDALHGRGAWPVWVLSNNDQVRHRTRYGGSEARARVAAVVLLTLRGTPFLFAGEELGLDDAPIRPDERVDAGGRDGCRAPIPWDASTRHGWPAEPWLPFPPDPTSRNAATQAKDPVSLPTSARLPAIEPCAHRWLVATAAWSSGVLAFERRAGEDRRVTVANFADAPAVVAVDDDWYVEVASSDPTSSGPWDGTVGPSEAVVLRPAPAR